MTIPFLKDRLNDFNVASFFNEMFLTSKLLGKYECKIQDCPINTLIIPVLQKKRSYIIYVDRRHSNNNF